jgi:predicted transcriptional regulator
MRDHHLRARRLKLGVTQLELGLLCYWPPGSAQAMISHAERQVPGDCGPARVRRIREALIYLESAKRRAREWQRHDDVVVRRTEEAICLGLRRPVVDRMVDLLWDNRGEEFDTLATLVPADWSTQAGNEYQDMSTPMVA